MARLGIFSRDGGSLTFWMPRRNLLNNPAPPNLIQVDGNGNPFCKEDTMLVLSRHRDEQIMIGDDIVIYVVDIRGDKVRLGIIAPQDTPVHRREVYLAIQRENAKAKASLPADK